MVCVYLIFTRVQPILVPAPHELEPTCDHRILKGDAVGLPSAMDGNLAEANTCTAKPHPVGGAYGLGNEKLVYAIGDLQVSDLDVGTEENSPVRWYVVPLITISFGPGRTISD